MLETISFIAKIDVYIVKHYEFGGNPWKQRKNMLEFSDGQCHADRSNLKSGLLKDNLKSSKVLTIWKKFGRFSGFDIQHCCIKCRKGSGQWSGISGLAFCTNSKYQSAQQFFIECLE